MSNIEVSVILPAYNSSSFICNSVKQLISFFVQQKINGEIIVVDDGSQDNTIKKIPKNKIIQVIRLTENLGKGAAIKRGMLEAKGNVRIFTDADLPYGTQPILPTINYISKRKFHAVLGDRTLPSSKYRHIKGLRRVLSTLGSLIFRTLITGGYYDTQCGFKGFSSDVAIEVFSMTRVNRFAIDVEVIYLLLKYNLDIKKIPVKLCSHNSSSIHIIRESVRVFFDIIGIYLNKFRGVYVNDRLPSIWEEGFRD